MPGFTSLNLSLYASLNHTAASKQGSRVAEKLEGEETDLHPPEVTLTEREG